MWDFVVDFFSGVGDVVTSAASGVAEAVTSFGSWAADLFDGGTATADVATVASDGGKTVADGVSSLAVDAPDKESLSDMIHSNEGIFADAAQVAKNVPDVKKDGLISSLWNQLDEKGKAKALEIIGGVAAGAGVAALKGGQAEKLQDRKYELEAEIMQKKQAMNKVPAGVPFKPKKGGLLSNQMGQLVALPQNPMKPRGLIYGGING